MFDVAVPAVSGQEGGERRVVVPAGWADLSTLLQTIPGPLCPVDCQTGALSLAALEEQGLAVSEQVLYIAERSRLSNISQLCLQGRDDPISVVLEDPGQEKDCSRWCSRWADLKVIISLITLTLGLALTWRRSARLAATL